jgi:hypothetical protein
MQVSIIEPIDELNLRYFIPKPQSSRPSNHAVDAGRPTALALARLHPHPARHRRNSANRFTPTIENNNLFATDGRNISGSHLLKCAVSAEGSISNRTWPMKVSVRRFKSLAIGLKELEPFIRNGQHLATGRPFKRLNGMRSREALQSHQ